VSIPRVIPALLLDGNEFVKTTRFRDPRYVGDPVNTIDLFNQFEVDEIAVLDIAATIQHREPAYDLLEALAAQCWVPLAYGGGIRSLEMARRVFAIGVEKVILGSILADDPGVASRIAREYGRQAVVAAIDVRIDEAGPTVLVDHGTRPVSGDPVDYARRAETSGVGEILLQAIHRDGTREGYDLDLIRSVVSGVDVPVVALGGAGRRADLSSPVHLAGAAAVAAGSLFVFQGTGSGVLVNFPGRRDLEGMFASPGPSSHG
jgi:cyclase